MDQLDSVLKEILRIAVYFRKKEARESLSSGQRSRNREIERLDQFPDILDPVSGKRETKTLSLIVVDSDSSVLLVDVGCKVEQKIDVFRVIVSKTRAGRRVPSAYGVRNQVKSRNEDAREN